MKLTDFLSKYATPVATAPVRPLNPELLFPIDDLPADPSSWPDDWRYAFIERSGLLMNTGVTQEEADRVAESIVRKQYTDAIGVAAVGGALT